MPTAQRPATLPNRYPDEEWGVGVGWALRLGDRDIPEPEPAAFPLHRRAAARRPLPDGAVKWSRTWLDEKGRAQTGDHPVPVDADDRRTPHVRHTCRGRMLLNGVEQPCDQVGWLLPGGRAQFCPDHGHVLTAEQVKREPLLPWAAMWRAVEPGARPLWLFAVELAAGVALRQAEVPAWEALAATPALAAAGYVGTRTYLVKRAIRRGKLEKGQRDGRRMDTIRARARTALYAGTAAGVWLAAATATDPATPAGWVGWGASPLLLLAAAPWWRHLAALRHRPAPELPPPLPATVAADGYDLRAVRDADDWAAGVAGAADGLPNTYVDKVTWQADPGGRRMVIRASKGALTDERIRRALPLIAATFNVKRSAIGWVEEYEGSPRAALLLVQPDSPLNDPQTWKPIDVVPVDDARLHLGTRIDASDLYTRLWTPGWGAPSRSFYGTKGSGKTEGLRLLLLGMLKARVQTATGPRRLVAPFLHDPKLGKDFGAFRRQVCGFSTTQETLHMVVDALIREMDRRYQMLADYVWVDDKGREQEGEQPFDPTVHGPVISLLIDEFHEPARDPTLLAKLDLMSRKMRAAGIEIVIATHMTTLGDTGTQSFRDMVSEEVALFRTTSGLTGLATGGRNVGDPRLLPREPGMNLFASGEQDTMQARMAFVPRGALYDMLYDDDNVSRVQPVEWPAETLEAFGPEFVAWMDACQRRPVGAAAPKPPPNLLTAGPVASADDLSAAEALRRVLFEATSAVGRPYIAEHPLWVPRSVTSTLTAALNAGQSASPPWLVKSGGGKATVFALTAAAREEYATRLAEAAA